MIEIILFLIGCYIFFLWAPGYALAAFALSIALISWEHICFLRKEADYLKKQMDEIQGRIKTYDNNLGFFKSSSKGVNPFMKEIEDKIIYED